LGGGRIKTEGGEGNDAEKSLNVMGWIVIKTKPDKRREGGFKWLVIIGLKLQVEAGSRFMKKGRPSVEG